jgi:hypothetical protein
LPFPFGGIFSDEKPSELNLRSTTREMAVRSMQGLGDGQGGTKGGGSEQERQRDCPYCHAKERRRSSFLFRLPRRNGRGVCIWRSQHVI